MNASYELRLFCTEMGHGQERRMQAFLHEGFRELLYSNLGKGSVHSQRPLKI
jgi:hypothetical protein